MDSERQCLLGGGEKKPSNGSSVIEKVKEIFNQPEKKPSSIESNIKYKRF